MSGIDIPLIDIAAFRDGTPEERLAIAQRMDRALQDSGFLMLAGHDVDPGLAARLRASASRFFALPTEEKAEIATPMAGRGWLRMGVEAATYAGESVDPALADLKESLTWGRAHKTGDAETDVAWFRDNVYPRQCPEMQELAEEYAEQVRRVYYDLLRMSALALGLDEEWFVGQALDSPHTFNINRYPPRAETGAAREGQFRIGPHTDWGIYTILDRQPGYGGLQVQTLQGDWVDAPYEPGALTINVGDLLARWTGDRWRSTRHRVLPPPPEAPQEELISLILFLEVDMSTLIAPALAPAGASAGYEPVVAGDYFRMRATESSAA